MIKLFLVRETWSHMAEVSGFDPLFAAFEQRKAVDSRSFFVHDFQHAPKLSRWQRVWTKQKPLNISEAYSPFVEQKHERLAQALVIALQEQNDAQVMLSVTENQFAPSLAKLSDSQLARFVLFVHQPPAWFRLYWKQMGVFAKVKAVVCLCQHQADFFKSIGARKVIQIRHGVNLDFFTPTKQSDTSYTAKKLLFVGQWLRDMKILSEAFAILNKHHANIELHCVVPQRNRVNNPYLYQLAQSEKVFWYDQITAMQLRDLYQSAHCLMLPLIDATANNALNEAMACGLPVVTTEVGGTSDYVFPQGALLAKPHDADDFAQQCLTMLQQWPKYINKAQAIRTHAETHLDWNLQIDHLLKQLMD